MSSLTRTVVVPTSQGQWWWSPPIRWPVDNKQRSLIYTVDFANVLADAGNPYITAASVQSSPYGTGELTIENVYVSGSSVMMNISGGAAGRLYRVLVNITGSDDQIWSYVIQLQLGNESKISYSASPQFPGFSPVVIWDLDGMSLIESQQLTSGNIALAF